MDRGATQKEPFSLKRDDRLEALMNAVRDLGEVLDAIEAKRFRGKTMAETMVRRMRENVSINEEERKVKLFADFNYKGSDLYVYYQAQKADLSKIVEHVANHGVDELDESIRKDDPSAVQLFTLYVVNAASALGGDVEKAFRKAFADLGVLGASERLMREVEREFQ